jgi:hypothetical protein
MAMQTDPNARAALPLDARFPGSQRLDPEAESNAPQDSETEDPFVEERLIRLWYSIFPDSFVE